MVKRRKASKKLGDSRSNISKTSTMRRKSIQSVPLRRSKRNIAKNNKEHSNHVAQSKTKQIVSTLKVNQKQSKKISFKKSVSKIPNVKPKRKSVIAKSRNIKPKVSSSRKSIIAKKSTSKSSRKPSKGTVSIQSKKSRGKRIKQSRSSISPSRKSARIIKNSSHSNKQTNKRKANGDNNSTKRKSTSKSSRFSLVRSLVSSIGDEACNQVTKTRSKGLTAPSVPSEIVQGNILTDVDSCRNESLINDVASGIPEFSSEEQVVRMCERRWQQMTDDERAPFYRVARHVIYGRNIRK